jgi:hypothetical protein
LFRLDRRFNIAPTVTKAQRVGAFRENNLFVARERDLKIGPGGGSIAPREGRETLGDGRWPEAPRAVRSGPPCATHFMYLRP